MSSADCYPDKAPRVDQLLDTLCNTLRREIIHFFESDLKGDTASLDEVVTYIDRRVPGTTPAELEIALHHAHLPKLENRSWIDYDSRMGDIHYHGKGDAEQYLAELTAVFAE